MFHIPKRGFTLIETMVAVSILTLAVAGPLYTASRAIVAAETSRDRLTASYLAQEGIEYVRMMRDNEYLIAYRDRATIANVSAAAWDNFLNGAPADTSAITRCRGPAKICTLGPVLGSATPLAECPGGSCTASFSVVPGGTVFVRTIQATDLSNEETIVSKVTWWFHSAQYSVTTSDHLTPWQ